MTAPSPELAAKVAGSAIYARDLIDRGAALVAFVRSPHPHAELVSVDPSPALRLPGVLAVLTGADFAPFLLGHGIADQPVLAVERVRHVGEPVAAVCAATTEALAAAVAAVRVAYRPLPHALTPNDALALGVAIHDACADNVASERIVDRGDWDRVASTVAAWAEGDFAVGPQHHAPMEPHCALATWAPGEIVLHAPVHCPHSLVHDYAPHTARWEESFAIRTPVIGGSFGARYEHPLHLVCGELARRLRRDVGVVQTRREDFLTSYARMAMTMRVRIGATADGRIVAKECDVLADNGAYSLHGPPVAAAAAVRSDNLYRFEAVRTRARTVYTNGVPSQCFRGFGSPQAIFAQEQLVDELARTLRLDPIEIRHRSATRSGDRTIHGWRVDHAALDRCLDAIDAASRGQTVAPDLNEGRWRRGRGVACGVHVVSNRAAHPDGDFALVRLDVTPDGRLRAASGEVEIGAGTVGTLRSLVAGALGIPAPTVDVVVGDTATTPPGLGSFASRTSFFAGNAALEAAALLKARAAAMAQGFGLAAGASFAEVAAAATREARTAELSVTGSYVPDGVTDVDASLFGNVSPTYTFSAHVCWVRVDCATGAFEIERYVAAHDAGTVLDETSARGQVIGGVVQGMGYARLEESVVDGAGKMLNPGFLDYRIPTAADVFPVEPVFVDSYEPAGPQGAKTIAEPPLIPVAACLANAIHDATGGRVRALPLSPERVLGAIPG
jgi:CO/xanthine dehydrogenase Mo-binding subunit